ncbi:dimethylaniline monooxygenase [N-oxide-forming] 2 isoform X1 [Pelobates cultripes]|uniref:Flavin-containing monooxygenase n=1 Tax=Pelobates cultripes TaxID=61616 RepID=A0AAD1WL26_PELCU|nr:dimethylaniline monooxygenase [N-oxide-forming] 2 isoform X1 [Pelobates cultripes]
MAKRVAIIGAGCSGLAAIKCCLEEGLEPTCFEKSEDIGGLWRYTETVEEGRASIYSSVVTNTSKEMMCYSDFPMPADFPAYLHSSKVLEYLRLYAEHFRLLKYIQFKTEVCCVTKHSDFSSSGQWEIITEKNGSQRKTIFDAILVGNGHFFKPYLPMDSLPGIEKFQGYYIHSRFYKKSEDYRGKTVLVVGIGNSAGDISSEISSIAKQVYISTYQGSWVLSRVSKWGFPLDMMFSTRCHFGIMNTLPSGLRTKLIEKQLNSWFDHENYGLQPKDRSTLKEPIVNDYLPSNILCGAVRVKPKIKQFTETSVIFEDETMIKDVDAIIFATGYSFSFPFLDDSIIKVNDDNKLNLYKYVFPPHLEKPTLAFLGVLQPFGAIIPVVELQSRWATRIFKGVTRLPPVHEMESHIKKTEDKQVKTFTKSRNQTLQMHFIEYMDEVAMEIGIRPSLMHLLFTDPQLAYHIFFGPCTPYQYRLYGPGKWPGARKAILTQWNRTLNPSRTRVINSRRQSLKRKLRYSGTVVQSSSAVGHLAGLRTKLIEKQLNSWFDHENYGLQPKDRSTLKEPIVNDYLPSNILCGAVRVKPKIKQFTETSVIFEDETMIKDVDAIIFATGYSFSFPFLDDSIIKVNDDNKLNLYKYVFPPHLEKPTLAFLGVLQPFGAIIPVVELQSRWATRIFKGVTRLPPVHEMESHIKKTEDKQVKTFTKSRNQTLQMHFIEYMDEVAMEIGIRPSLMHLLFTDPQLAYHIFFGPCTPYQYRLYGPGKWPGARKAILTQWNRTLNPSRTRVTYKCQKSKPHFKRQLGILVMLITILVGLYYMSFQTFL